MPKLGMEPIRKAALVNATIAEIGRTGSLDVTVSQIAKRAGMSSALAHHYFGGKEAMFLAAMRHVLTLYGAEVRGALAVAEGPKARVHAIVRASFTPANFRREVVGAWLNFYVMAQTMPEAATASGRSTSAGCARTCATRCARWSGARAVDVAEAMAALIDGVYLRQVLTSGRTDKAGAVNLVLGVLDVAAGAGGGRMTAPNILILMVDQLDGHAFPGRPGRLAACAEPEASGRRARCASPMPTPPRRSAPRRGPRSCRGSCPRAPASMTTRPSSAATSRPSPTTCAGRAIRPPCPARCISSAPTRCTASRSG